MLVVLRKVYYCDHCKRHRLQAAAIEEHERRCTMNPERECRWCGKAGKHAAADQFLATGTSPLKQEDIDWVHDLVNGCPGCMLAILRQSGLDYHSSTNFDYEKIVEEWREAEHVETQLAEIREIESTWL